MKLNKNNESMRRFSEFNIAERRHDSQNAHDFIHNIENLSFYDSPLYKTRQIERRTKSKVSSKLNLNIYNESMNNNATLKYKFKYQKSNPINSKNKVKT